MSNAALAEVVHLSPSQCSRRRSALEATGVIARYRACLNASALGLSLQAIVRLNLKDHDQMADMALGAWLQTQPEVQSAVSLTGDADYLLTIWVEDMEAFSSFVHDKLLRHPQITQVRSEFVLKTLKDSQSLRVVADL